jgi:uncharacterized protein YukE
VHFLCVFFLLSSQAVWSQDFSSIDTDLQALEDLIADTLTNTQEQQKLLEDLRQSLSESADLIASYENIITERENLLRNLQAHLAEMYETYKRQSALSAKYEKSLKLWRNCTLIGIPAAALLSGVVVWAAVR